MLRTPRGSLLPTLPGELPGAPLWERPKGCMALKVSISPWGAESQGNVLLSLNKKHNFLGYQVVGPGLSEAVLMAATTSGLLATGAAQAVLGDSSGCCGVAKLPLFSRGLITGHLKEATPWIKASGPRTH